LVSVFANAILIKQQPVRMFQNYPPRDREETIYGATQKTYERVTRTKSSLAVFMKGLSLLLQKGIKLLLHKKLGDLHKFLCSQFMSVKYRPISSVLYHHHMPALFLLDRRYPFPGMIFG